MGPKLQLLERGWERGGGSRQLSNKSKSAQSYCAAADCHHRPFSYTLAAGTFRSAAGNCAITTAVRRGRAAETTQWAAMVPPAIVRCKRAIPVLEHSGHAYCKLHQHLSTVIGTN